jgi:hypothetical protein
MAVVQISRIQLRRGKVAPLGGVLPQLASGELAWAIDAQKLYIGSGSVGEGAPAVDNIEVLTTANKSTLLDLVEYIYKSDETLYPNIQTGATENFPVSRLLQDRLDDYVSSANYGIVPLAETDNTTDQTEDIQRAITNLFLDTVGDGTKARVVLTFLPGRYRFESTIYIPSYVRIEGAGKDHTIFNFTGTGSAFEFVNDTSTNGNYISTWASGVSAETRYNQQPKFCYLKGFTLNTTDVTAVGLQLNNVRDSMFDDIAITGDFMDDPSTFVNTGIDLYGYSSVVTCERNIFNNVYVTGFKYGVYSKYDIINNRFTACEITDGRFGIDFGVDSDQVAVGQQYGPRFNTIKDCYFGTISREGIRIGFGTGNRTIGNTFVAVGTESNSNYNIIKFDVAGNTSTNDTFDRLSFSSGTATTVYKKEVSGKVHYEQIETRTATLIYKPAPFELIRIPYTTSTGFEITYILESATLSMMRRGKLLISVDFTGSTNLQLVDEYEYTGAIGEDTAIIFTAVKDEARGCIIIKYENSNNPDTSTMTYTYRSIS